MDIKIDLKRNKTLNPKYYNHFVVSHSFKGISQVMANKEK